MANLINGSTVDNFRNDFQLAMAELEEKYGVVINLGTITYDETSMRGKMTALKGTRGEELRKEDFKVGEIVKIAHRKVLPTSTFEIIKINSKKIRVQGDGGIFNVDPSLLRKI